MLQAMYFNFDRFRKSTHKGRRYPGRIIDRVCVSRNRKNGKHMDRIGPAYNSAETVTVLLSDIIDVTEHVLKHSYLRVGRQIRHMKVGTPIGGQTSAQLASGTAKYLEHPVDDVMPNPERNLSLAFMDDSHLRILYYTKVTPDHPWSYMKAKEYVQALQRGYCNGLELE